MKKGTNYIKIIFTLLFIALILAGFMFYSNIIFHLLIAFFLTYLIKPFIVNLEQRGISRFSAIMIVYLVLIGIITTGVVFIFPVIIEQVKILSDFYHTSLTEYNILDSGHPLIARVIELFDMIEESFNIHISLENLQQAVSEKFTESLTLLPGILIDSLSNIFSVLLYFLTIPVITFLLLLDREKIKKYIYELIPNRYFELSIITAEKVDATIGSYLRGIFVQIIIISFLMSVVLSVIGVKFSVIIGIFAGLANAIPYIGPAIGIAGGALSVLITGGELIMILQLVIGMLFVQLIDNTLVYPLVMSRNTKMHPLVIILTVISGGYAFGLLGMLLSVPVLSVIRGIYQVLSKNLKEFEII